MVQWYIQYARMVQWYIQYARMVQWYIQYARMVQWYIQYARTVQWYSAYHCARMVTVLLNHSGTPYYSLCCDSESSFQIAVSTPTSSTSPSLAMSSLQHAPPSLPPSLPHSNIPPSLGSTPLPAFPVLSQPLPPPSLTLSSSLPSHPPAPHTGISQFMQGLQTALNPHQPPFSNPLATAPFANPRTSIASSLGNPSLPLLPTIYPYGPYGGVGGVPVVQSGPVSVGVVGGGPVNCGGGPGVLPTAPFPSHSLMPAYSTYLPPAMYPNNQITPPSST